MRIVNRIGSRPSHEGVAAEFDKAIATCFRGGGIPTRKDWATQALYLLGLDPIVETQGDANSYGFRQHRNCADVLVQCHRLLSKPNSPRWILEGDIKACFDEIGHTWLLDHVPMDRTVLAQWLKAGYLEKDVFFATTEGTPQGGIISPALANRTLDRLQALLHERFGATRSMRERNQVHLSAMRGRKKGDGYILPGTAHWVQRTKCTRPPFFRPPVGIIGAAVLLGDNVLFVKRQEIRVVLMQAAVFTTLTCPLPDDGPESGVQHSP